METLTGIRLDTLLYSSVGAGIRNLTGSGDIDYLTLKQSNLSVQFDFIGGNILY